MITEAPVTVSPRWSAAPLELEFRGAIADADGSATAGGRFGYQVHWRKIAYVTEFPENYPCQEAWASERLENEVDFVSEWLSPGTVWHFGWNDQGSDWTELSGTTIETGVPFGAWDAIETSVSMSTEATSSSFGDTPGVGIDDAGVAVYEQIGGGGG